MNKKIEIKKGEKFGEYTIIRETEGKRYKRGDPARCFLVKCSCGRKRNVLFQLLRRGTSKSCGCLNKVQLQKGDKYGKLTIIKEIKSQISLKGNKTRLFKCICECGNFCTPSMGHLKNGHTKSCGCLNELSTARIKKGNKLSLTHGMSYTKEYKIWDAMIQRCTNKKARAYKWYGGRSIKVCKSWLKFENFYKDMGNIPEGLTLERINVNGNYCRENCKWANTEEQSKNKRNNHFVFHNGQKLCITDWSKKLGGGESLVATRINELGWDPIVAVTTPVGKYIKSN